MKSAKLEGLVSSQWLRSWKGTSVILGLAGLLGCASSDGAAGRKELDVARDALIVNQANAFGFEDRTQWRSNVLLSPSTIRTQGSFSLGVKARGYTNVTSVSLPSLSSVLDAFAIDVRLPTAQPNPYWYGAVQMYVSVPSKGVYDAYLGQQELTGRPLNQFFRLDFAIAPALANVLRAGGYTDFRVNVVLNVPTNATGSYLLDNLRFVAARPPCAQAADYKLKVLALRYLPLDGDRLDLEETGVDSSLADMQAKLQRLDREVEERLEDGSRYRGYKDAAAACSIDYEIVANREYHEALPLSSFEVPWNPGTFRPDYVWVLNRENICNLVDQGGVRQVWLWGYHTSVIEPTESNMSGPYGDISNSELADDMPHCLNSYVLYNYNYGRDLGEALEDHTHQLEAVLKYLDFDLFWNKFVNPYGQQNGVVNHCGWTHFPPNGQADYDWMNPLQVLSDCEDWNPAGTGVAKVVDCNTWSCPDDDGVAFKVWWMQNHPGRNNGLVHNGQPLRNWWEVTARFDQVVAAGTGLTL
jgi:hypothetical protein